MLKKRRSARFAIPNVKELRQNEHNVKGTASLLLNVDLLRWSKAVASGTKDSKSRNDDKRRFWDKIRAVKQKEIRQRDAVRPVDSGARQKARDTFNQHASDDVRVDNDGIRDEPIFLIPRRLLHNVVLVRLVGERNGRCKLGTQINGNDLKRRKEGRKSEKKRQHDWNNFWWQMRHSVSDRLLEILKQQSSLLDSMHNTVKKKRKTIICEKKNSNVAFQELTTQSCRPSATNLLLLSPLRIPPVPLRRQCLRASMPAHH